MALFYPFKKLYYSENGKNIYKTCNRYYYKKILLAIFGILIFLNIFEIVFHIIVAANPKRPEQYDENLRAASCSISFINIVATITLCTMTVFKLEVQTYTYY